jgi:DNA adenine methylase
MAYPGGKGGLFRRLINLIPPHRVYIETHLGGGAVLRNKRPAEQSIGIELDAQVLAAWSMEEVPGLRLVHGDATEFLRQYDFCGDEFVYVDPPYVRTARRRPQIYRCELDDDAHEELLTVVDRIPAKVMVSGYANPLYQRRLPHWHRVEFAAGSHGLRHSEVVWLNYEPPDIPFDTRYAGDTFRERQRIKRKQERLRRRIQTMAPIERDLLYHWILENCAHAPMANGALTDATDSEPRRPPHSAEQRAAS